MPAQTTNLFLLEDVGRTSELAQGDLDALHAVADWIKTYVVKPHKDLGRAGTVCPFVPGSLERKTLWLAPEQIADRDVPEVVEPMSGYKRLLLDTRPTDGDDVIYNVIVVVFSDLSADRAQGVFDDVLQHLAAPSYVEDGILFGPYMESPATGSSFWTTRSGSTCGRIVMGSSVPTLLLRNYAACRGAWGATNPRVASLRKELRHAADGGPEGTPRRRRSLGGVKPRPRSGRAFVDVGKRPPCPRH